MLRPLYDESDGEDGFVSLEVSPAQAHDTEAHAQGGPRPARAHRPAEPLREGAGDQGGRAGHRDADRRGPQHQRHADLRARPLRRGDGGLPPRPRGARGGRARGRAGARWPAWPPSSSAGSTPRWTAAWRPWPAGRRVTPPSSACGAPPRWPRPRRPTSTSTAPSAGDRWEALRAKGARVQRPLWASTSTKNPGYSDLLYVDNLIGPATVNTMPEPTLRAFEDHGTLKRTVDADPDGAAARPGPPGRRRHRHARRRADARGRRRPLASPSRSTSCCSR